MTDLPRYLTAQAVAAYMSISRNMVDILVRRGKLPPAISLGGRLKRWDREAIDATLAGNPELMQPLLPVSDISRRIADGIAAKGRLSPAPPARRRHGADILPLARDRSQN